MNKALEWHRVSGGTIRAEGEDHIYVVTHNNRTGDWDLTVFPVREVAGLKLSDTDKMLVDEDHPTQRLAKRVAQVFEDDDVKHGRHYMSRLTRAVTTAYHGW